MATKADKKRFKELVKKVETLEEELRRTMPELQKICGLVTGHENVGYSGSNLYKICSCGVKVWRG